MWTVGHSQLNNEQQSGISAWKGKDCRHEYNGKKYEDWINIEQIMHGSVKWPRTENMNE
jgi:hypothetical protein